jgi:hypothetical protein
MKTFHLLLAAAALVVIAAGAGYAAIPASDGTISACKDSRGTLKVIDAEAGQTCKADQRLLTWNQHGPAATSGREIITSDNPQPDGAAFKTAHAYCPAGKVSVGGGANAYAVNADGSYGFAHGIALAGSGPIDEVNGSSGWFAHARVVDPTTAEAAWKLTAYAICVAAA